MNTPKQKENRVPTPPTEVNFDPAWQKALAVGVVVIIFLVLAGLSIPCFFGYKERNRNATADADLTNAVVAQEAYYVDHQTYATSTEILVGTTYGLFISDGVEVTVIEADSDSYVMSAYHTEGNDTYFVSGPGGSVMASRYWEWRKGETDSK